jgi:hypothetical protein
LPGVEKVLSYLDMEPGFGGNSRGAWSQRMSVSRTAYDMLIGAAAASAGLWVLGITVVVSYLALKGNHD